MLTTVQTLCLPQGNLVGRKSRLTKNVLFYAPSITGIDSHYSYVRYQGRIYGEEQVSDLIAAFGASNNLSGERIELLRNNAQPGEKPRWESLEKLSAKNYQTRLLMEFAEVAAESEGARYVWIEPDGRFGYAIDPDEIPEGVQSVAIEETLAVRTAA